MVYNVTIRHSFTSFRSPRVTQLSRLLASPNARGTDFPPTMCYIIYFKSIVTGLIIIIILINCLICECYNFSQSRMQFSESPRPPSLVACIILGNLFSFQELHRSLGWRAFYVSSINSNFCDSLATHMATHARPSPKPTQTSHLPTPTIVPHSLPRILCKCPGSE